MDNRLRRVCTICARGGSKGLPGKNLRELGGKPLIVHSIIQAKQSDIFDAIAVSSDSERILDVASASGVRYVIKRPAEMAGDTASKLPAIRHCVEQVENQSGTHFDTVVDIDVTSPLRTALDIRGSVELMETNGVTNVITGAPARKNPFFNMVQQLPDGHVDLCIRPQGDRLERRQDAPAVFDMNAAVYVWDRNAFFEHMDVFYSDTLLFEMPENRSHDIDSPLDFDIVEMLMKRNSK